MSRRVKENNSIRLGWRFATGVLILVGAYGAWPLIPFVVLADLDPGIKSGLTAVLGATPFMSKFVVIALMGRPAYDFLKRTVWQWIRTKYARENPALAPYLASSDTRPLVAIPIETLPKHETREG